MNKVIELTTIEMGQAMSDYLARLGVDIARYEYLNLSIDGNKVIVELL